jgi:hypothetical protein
MKTTKSHRLKKKPTLTTEKELGYQVKIVRHKLRELWGAGGLQAWPDTG